MSKIRNYLSLVKFSHTVFALPFALIGFFCGVKSASVFPGWTLFGKVILCMVFARTAAMAFNRLVDRHIDALNERTMTRELPKGIISPFMVTVLVLLSCFLFILTTYTINDLCFYLSPVALGTVLVYSYTKRFTWLCHVVLGLGLSLAPVGAFLAVTGVFDWLPILYALMVITWVSGFDIIYALQDEQFDKTNRLHSVPARFGHINALRISSLIHVVTASLSILTLFKADAGWLQWTGTLIFMGLLFYQHRIVKPGDLSRVDAAFFSTNGLASIIYAAFVIADLFR